MYAVERYVRCSGRMLSGDVEVDEVYVNAGLKGRGNHDRIILLGRGPRCRGLRAGRGRGGWDKDVIPVFTIIGRDGLRGVEPRTTSDYGGEIGRHASTGREERRRVQELSHKAQMVFRTSVSSFLLILYPFRLIVSLSRAFLAVLDLWKRVFLSLLHSPK